MPGDPLGPSAADDDDLRWSLIRLSQLATSTLTLPETLIQVACLARLAIPASDGVGLNLAQSRGSDSSAATSELIENVGAVQCGLEEGPAVTAVAEARTVRHRPLDRYPDQSKRLYGE